MSSFQDELKAHLKAAKAYGELSNAKRLKVGAIIVKEGRIISIGRNGMPSGSTNICEEDEVTRKEVIHAEKNAVAFAAKNGVSTNNCLLVLTHSPCIDCATLMIQAGIKEVYYEREYRITDGINFLKENNIHVEQIKE